MPDITLDPSETRPARAAGPRPARGGALRVTLAVLAGAGGLGAFGVAISSVMAGLAAPPPPALPRPAAANAVRAADWPDLKDGLPALAGGPAATKGGQSPVPQPAEAPPADPPLRLAALPAPALPAPALPGPGLAAPPPAPAQRPEARIPVPTPVPVIGPARHVVPLAPARTAVLQPLRPTETIRAREVAEPAPVAATPAALPPAPVAAAAEKPARKAATRNAPPARPAAEAAAKTGASAKTGAGKPPPAVVTAEAEPEETDVLGIKLPSLAPAGRKIKEGVDALGEAVRNVF